MDTPEERALTADVFEALDLSPAQFLTDGGLVNRGKLRAAFWYPHDYLPEGHWMRAADEGRLRAENAALKRDLQYARDGLTKGRTRLREDNERLRAALRQLVDVEDMRLRLRQLHEMGHGTDYADYHRLLPLAWAEAREALGPNVEGNSRAPGASS